MKHTVRSLAKASPLSASISAGGLVLIVFSVATCGRAGEAPTTPTPVPQAVVRAVAITSPTPALTVGDSVQLQAQAEWLDGHREDVTARAQWNSRSPQCGIDAAAVAIAVAEGECSIEARFGDVASTLALTVRPRPRYVEEVFEMARGTPWGPPLERSYEIDVHESGLFSITLEWFNWEYPDDRFLVELREAATGTVLVSHRTCGGLTAPECNAQAAALPITFGAAVRGGHRVVLRVRNSTYLSFRLRVNRPY